MSEENKQGRPKGRKVRGMKREWNKRNKLVLAAMRDGWTTYSKIAKATGLSIGMVQSVFKQYPDTYSSFVVARRTIVDIAADNINDIVADPKHPHHFAASKYVLANYKSDLDIHLETKDGEEEEIEVKSGGGPVVITFGKKKKEDKNESEEGTGN